MVQLEHPTMVLGIQMNLPRILAFAVRNSKRVADLDFSLAADSQQRADHARLRSIPSQVVVKNGKKSHLVLVARILAQFYVPDEP